jgi:mutator protein MutT
VTTLVVAAAVIERGDCVLVTRRQAGVHLAGQWEFPGGKCEPGEGLDECLKREIREELAVEIVIGHEILATTHEYDGLRVQIHFRRCRLLGEPSPQLGQEMRWVPRETLASLEFPPADGELIKLLTDERSS